MAALLLVNACGSVDGDGFEPEGSGDTATTEDALFDANTMDATARQALPLTGGLTVASAFDPFGTGRQVEFCGLIMRKSNGTFHASTPVTSNQEKFCKTTITVPVGSTIVGYYHSHTPVSIPGISPQDITEANKVPKRTYYVVSTVTKCAQKYVPGAARPTDFGCFIF